MTGPTSAPRIRPATAADSEPCYRLFWETLTDLAARNGTPWEGTAEERWPYFTDLYELLAEIAAEWWVAEDDGGAILGYARSVERGADRGLLELSEFFVRPGHQARGIGSALLHRAFPVGRGTVRAIIATGDVRALARYHRADTSIQFPILGMTGVPSADAADRLGLQVDPIDEASLPGVGSLEASVLGHPRGEPELRWLLERREGWRYVRDGALVGFAFVGRGGVGPIAAIGPEHLPEILLHVEARAAVIGREEIGFEVPAPAVVAVRHLLARGFRFDPFITYLMANRPFGRFDRFLGFTPPFVL